MHIAQLRQDETYTFVKIFVGYTVCCVAAYQSRLREYIGNNYVKMLSVKYVQLFNLCQ